MGLISLMIVMLLVTGWFKRDTGDSSAFDYAPVKNTSIATFDLGMNMGDLVNTVANIASQSNSENSMMAKSVLENIPDMSFVDVKGFALLDQKNSSDFALGLRFSGRTDPKKAVDQILSKLSPFGIQFQKDPEGFIDIGEGSSALTLYLDDNHLLMSPKRQFLEQCLQTKHNVSTSIKNHPKWSKIEALVSGKPISYCGIFDVEGKEVVVVGVAQNLSNEVNFKVSWLDGVDQVNELVSGEMPFDLNLADLFKWQKNLSAAVSSTPDGTIRFAAPFAVTNYVTPKLEEGETTGFVKISDFSSNNQDFGICMKADKEKLRSFVELVIKTRNKVTPVEGGIMHVEPFSKLVEPSMDQKNETKTNTKTTAPKEFPLTTRGYAGNLSTGEFYYKLDGDSLYVANSIENLKWNPGRKEDVVGSIFSIVVDGKSLTKNLSAILPIYSSGMTGLGMSAEQLSEILQKIDIKVNADLLTSDKDLTFTISIKYNLEKALK